jgi:hypothetical protein
MTPNRERCDGRAKRKGEKTRAIGDASDRVGDLYVSFSVGNLALWTVKSSSQALSWDHSEFPWLFRTVPAALTVQS